MSYVLCEVETCFHHDGEGCTLETVEISKRATLAEWRDGRKNDLPRCLDYQDSYSCDDEVEE